MKSSPTYSIRPKTPLFAALGCLVLLAAALSLALGPVWISPGEVLSALFGGAEGGTGARIVLYARLPRTASQQMEMI